MPFQALAMVGHTVHAVCPDKKAGETVRTAVNYPDGAQFYCEVRGHDFTLNATFDGVACSDYDALLVPGGRFAEHVRAYPQVIEAVQHFARSTSPWLYSVMVCRFSSAPISAKAASSRASPPSAVTSSTRAPNSSIRGSTGRRRRELGDRRIMTRASGLAGQIPGTAGNQDYALKCGTHPEGSEVSRTVGIAPEK